MRGLVPLGCVRGVPEGQRAADSAPVKSAGNRDDRAPMATLRFLRLFSLAALFGALFIPGSAAAQASGNSGASSS